MARPAPLVRLANALPPFLGLRPGGHAAVVGASTALADAAPPARMPGSSSGTTELDAVIGPPIAVLIAITGHFLTP